MKVIAQHVMLLVYTNNRISLFEVFGSGVKILWSINISLSGATMTTSALFDGTVVISMTIVFFLAE